MQGALCCLHSICDKVVDFADFMSLFLCGLLCFYFASSVSVLPPPWTRPPWWWQMQMMISHLRFLWLTGFLCFGFWMPIPADPHDGPPLFIPCDFCLAGQRERLANVSARLIWLTCRLMLGIPNGYYPCHGCLWNLFKLSQRWMGFHELYATQVNEVFWDLSGASIHWAGAKHWPNVKF